MKVFIVINETYENEERYVINEAAFDSKEKAMKYIQDMGHTVETGLSWIRPGKDTFDSSEEYSIQSFDVK